MTTYTIPETIEMTGSPKQVAWATDLRAARIDEFRAFERANSDDPEFVGNAHAAIAWDNPDARYWIDARKTELAWMVLDGMERRESALRRSMDAATRADLEQRTIAFWAALAAHPRKNFLTAHPDRLAAEISIA